MTSAMCRSSALSQKLNKPDKDPKGAKWDMLLGTFFEQIFGSNVPEPCWQDISADGESSHSKFLGCKPSSFPRSFGGFAPPLRRQSSRKKEGSLFSASLIASHWALIDSWRNDWNAIGWCKLEAQIKDITSHTGGSDPWWPISFGMSCSISRRCAWQKRWRKGKVHIRSRPFSSKLTLLIPFDI